MRILFIVQGEGRGHLTQAITMEQMLRANGHEVVEVLVGKSQQRRIPDFFRREIHAPIYTFESPNFLPTAINKRSKLPRSVAYNLTKIPSFLKSILFIIKHVKTSNVDLVVNFYELLTGLTWFIARPQVPLVSVGHQYLFLHPEFEFPKVNSVPLFFLRFWTRLTSIGSQCQLALSFRRMDDVPELGLKVVPPLIRRDVLRCKPTRGNYILGYILNSGFSEEVIRWHKKHPEIELHFFWDKKGAPEITHIDPTLSFHQIDDNAFLREFANCGAYATTAGFESVCEGLYMQKPILLVPAHIEQDCNAHDASLSGAGVVSREFNLDKLASFSSSYRPDPQFQDWERMSSQRITSAIELAASQPIEHHLSVFSLLPVRLVAWLEG
ncbi:MAG: glycosyltransferase family protein [Prevotella sp.]|jgi:uncharacterized protein (TIGR00661 family)